MKTVFHSKPNMDVFKSALQPNEINQLSNEPFDCNF